MNKPVQNAEMANIEFDDDSVVSDNVGLHLFKQSANDTSGKFGSFKNANPSNEGGNLKFYGGSYSKRSFN